jgi:hypothetical protein
MLYVRMKQEAVKTEQQYGPEARVGVLYYYRLQGYIDDTVAPTSRADQ